MPKKVNVRKDYSYTAKKGPPVYKKAKISRKTLYLVLRGPGLNAQTVTEENVGIREFALKKHSKVKFIQGKTAEDWVKILKDAIPWAAGAVFNYGSLVDETGMIKKTLDKVLYDSVEVKDDDSYEDALAKLIQANKT